MTNALTTTQPGAGAVTLAGEAAREDMELLKERFLPEGTDSQFRLLLAFGRAKGLELITSQFYGVTRMTTVSGRKIPQMTIQVGVDGYRALAERTGDYDGQEGPFWCGPDGEWKDVWLDDTVPPVAAKVGIRRKSTPHVTWHIAKYREYVQTKDEWQNGPGGEGRKTGKKIPTGMWETMPSNQLAKCAETGALRKALPQLNAELGRRDDLPPEFGEFEVSVEGPDDMGETVAAPTRAPKPPVQRPRATVPQRPAEPPAAEAPPEWERNVVDADGVVIEGEFTSMDGEAPDLPPEPAAASHEATHTNVEPGPMTAKEWSAFWATLRPLGWTSDKVHARAGGSIKEWDRVEVWNLFDVLKSESAGA